MFLLKPVIVDIMNVVCLFDYLAITKVTRDVLKIAHNLAKSVKQTHIQPHPREGGCCHNPTSKKEERTTARQ